MMNLHVSLKLRRHPAQSRENLRQAGGFVNESPIKNTRQTGFWIYEKNAALVPQIRSRHGASLRK
jgi:hypothetical protein